MNFKELIRRLDAFKKIDSSVVVSSEWGGFLSILIVLVSFLLFGLELLDWQTPRHNYEFLVDQTSTDTLLDVNLDLTVAMKCEFLRVDVFDVAKVIGC